MLKFKSIFLIYMLMHTVIFSQSWFNPMTLTNEWSAYGIGDPYILKHKGIYYLYCSTKNGETGVKVWSSKDLVSWSYEGLCTTEPITRTAYAPEVIYWNGTFYMYTSPAGNGHYALSSNSPTGPFSVISNNFGRSIDGSVFIDDDAKWYFYHSSSGGIRGCVMTGPSNMGPSLNLNAVMNNSWTEGPTVFKRNGIYYLTYTGNHILSHGYRIDYASNNTGPVAMYTPARHQNPIIISTEANHRGLGMVAYLLVPTWIVIILHTTT
jgi:xylan 1,4-beta-xylosidase